MRQHLTYIQVHSSKQQQNQQPKISHHPSSTILLFQAFFQQQHPLRFSLQLPQPLLSLRITSCSERIQNQRSKHQLRFQRSRQLALFLDRISQWLAPPCLEINKFRCLPKLRHHLCSNSSPHRLARHNRQETSRFSDRQPKQDRTSDNNKIKVCFILRRHSSNLANYLILPSKQPKAADSSGDNP